MFKKLSSFMLLSVLSVIVVLFISFYFFSTYIHNKILKDEAINNTKSISEQIFNSMYGVMKKGWSRDELEEFTQSLKTSFKSSNFEINIYRSPSVEKQFGKTTKENLPNTVLNVFKSSQEMFYDDGNLITTIYPIVAKNECFVCHSESINNTILGAIEIKENLKKSQDSTKNRYLIFLLLISPFPLLLGFIISQEMMRRINNSFVVFNKKVEQITTIEDLKQLQTSKLDMGFDEFNTLLNNFNNLIEKLKTVAVDKELLEFEIRLLDKFIITSDIVKDWKEYIKDLLIEINTVIKAYSLFTMFRIDDHSFELEVFWHGTPKDETKKLFEEIAISALKKSPHFGPNFNYIINHNIADNKLKIPNLSKLEIEPQTKSLILDSPKIGGIVGIGVQSEIAKDPIKFIVIDSILTTLINLVGSIKAINKYTHDLEYYATRDPLTNLFNQRVFRDLLDYEIKRSTRHEYKFAVIVIDCDNFKLINDNYGHQFGDMFLQSLADEIEKIKRSDDICSRYGGDEFALILPEATEKEAYTLSKRLVEHFDNFSLETPNKQKARATISVGLSVFPDHANNAKDLFMIADNMMYRAKKSGKNGVQFPDQDDIAEIFQSTHDKTMLVIEAIKNNKIIPFFQPILDIKTNKININELLMRIEIEKEMITAGEFIEIAENLGVIHKMDYIVIEKAFKKLKECNYTGTLFINLSPKSLIINEFIENITSLANTYSIDKSKIVFEITERETVKSFSILDKFVQNLKMEGFKFAIDDFGSGFSTFHYIKKFPIDYIKIDGEFILNLKKDKKDLAFVKSIISLAKELDVKTVSEFVEDQETLNYLEEIGGDFAQGFHIAKPSENLICN